MTPHTRHETDFTADDTYAEAMAELAAQEALTLAAKLPLTEKRCLRDQLNRMIDAEVDLKIQIDGAPLASPDVDDLPF